MNKKLWNKFFLVSALFIQALCVDAQAFTGVSVMGTITTNPASNAVMANTGALPSTSSTATPASADYVLGLLYVCSVAATYELQILNGSGSVVTAYNMLLPCPANTLNQWTSSKISFSIPDGFSIRVINITSFTGTGQATIQYAIEGVN